MCMCLVLSNLSAILHSYNYVQCFGSGIWKDPGSASGNISGSGSYLRKRRFLVRTCTFQFSMKYFSNFFCVVLTRLVFSIMKYQNRKIYVFNLHNLNITSLLSQHHIIKILASHHATHDTNSRALSDNHDTISCTT